MDRPKHEIVPMRIHRDLVVRAVMEARDMEELLRLVTPSEPLPTDINAAKARVVVALLDSGKEWF